MDHKWSRRLDRGRDPREVEDIEKTVGETSLEVALVE